jgi:hypothetical protein
VAHSRNSEATPNKIRSRKPIPARRILWLLIVALPSTAFADAGTPLMWATMLHLVIGNAIIGVLEGFILAKVFSLKKVKCIGLMIAANYFSAWIGGFLISGAIARHLHMDLNTGWTSFWILVVATYAITLILEWPFVALCFRGSDNWFRRSLSGNFLVQSASYVLLFRWYWSASGTSLYTKAAIVSPKDLSLPESVLVYFISDRDGNVYARQLAGTQDRLIFDLHSTNTDDRLFVRPRSTNQTDSWDLLARVEVENSRDGKLVEIQRDFAGGAVCDSRASLSPPQYEGSWFNFGDVPRLGDAEKSDWRFETGFWPIEGLDGTNAMKHARVHLSFETPFGVWVVRNATHLPGDKVLFQLGEDQICVLEPDAKRVALLIHGRGPVAIIPKKTKHAVTLPNTVLAATINSRNSAYPEPISEAFKLRSPRKRRFFSQE